MTHYVRKTKDAPVMLLPEPDWSKVILGLKRQGYPVKQLCDKTGCTREMMYSVLAGRSKPSWTVGEYLRRLHDER